MLIGWTVVDVPYELEARRPPGMNVPDGYEAHGSMEYGSAASVNSPFRGPGEDGIGAPSGSLIYEFGREASETGNPSRAKKLNSDNGSVASSSGKNHTGDTRPISFRQTPGLSGAISSDSDGGTAALRPPGSIDTAASDHKADTTGI